MRVDSEPGRDPVLPGRSRPEDGGPDDDVPESRAYRLERLLLGPPLISDQLENQRLGKPTALAVLSSG